MTAALDALMQRAISNPADEPEFLRALLDAQLFVHRPQGDDDDRLRIVQFDRPDGLQVIPVFTDIHKAYAATSATVEIVGLKGRVLFEATRGATFMLNPNDTSCTLYPEEIADLLSGRPVSRAPIADHIEGVGVEPAEENDLWIARLVVGALEAIEPVTVLYQLKAHVPNSAGPPAALLVIGVPEQHAERAARAVNGRLEANAHRLLCAVDLTHFDPCAPVPDWLKPFAAHPVWRREHIH
ncbi:SseB family protein [Cognatilysobacter bugurensis]|uniref:SseB protein N-terminal domain-containing protein n=1 Tax=Cognatilysobacter bugurensis TaxID=543356 RepID=A0A918W644_9GAMM|nr:SseB family protein [Lysobacter bugurensis]GHA76569.1 hypothetical protein GCM10007067_12270 [Lysobacter bugurensis]